MKVWMLLFAAFAFPLNAAAQTDLERVASALRLERAVGEDRFIGILGGAGRAFMLANAALKIRNSAMLYCQPEALALNGLNYADIALEQYERNKSIYSTEPINEKSPVDAFVHALLLGLARTFPCK